MDTIRPIGDRVLVRRDEAEEETKGGIFVPATVRNPPQQGTVVAVGEGVYTESGNLIPLQAKPGNALLFGSHCGNEIEFNHETLVMLSAREMLAVVDGDEVRPVGDRVLVRRDDPKDKTDGGLFLPETAQKPPQTGVVVAHGEGIYTESGVLLTLPVSEGSRVIFGEGVGSEIEVKGEKLIMLGIRDIYGTVEAE